MVYVVFLTVLTRLISHHSLAGVEIRIFNMSGHKKYDIGKVNKRP